MSDSLETDLVETDSTSNNDQMLMGTALKSAREQRNMTVEDVCTHLRISPHQVKALEADDFAALPEAMITRGFIRNYARLLEIDAEPLLQAYRVSMPSAAPRVLTLKSENILITGKDKRAWLKYIIASLLIAFALGAWQFYMDYIPKLPVQQAVLPVKDTDIPADVSANTTPSTNAEISSGNTVTEPLPVAALPAAERVADEETQAAPAPADVPPRITSPATNTTTTTNTNTNQQLPADVKITAVKATAKLKLSFSQTSWVNVTDHNKKMIFDRIMPAGSEEMVEGEPPFEVVVGNAPGSKLVFNDKLVDLAPYTRSNVARVTLE